MGRAVVSLHDCEIRGVDAALVCRGAVRRPAWSAASEAGHDPAVDMQAVSGLHGPRLIPGEQVSRTDVRGTMARSWA
jgi:hypothetical protein